MNIAGLAPGRNPPYDVNAFIEIIGGGAAPAVKYEADKDLGLLFVDRFLSTSMTYPCHYGFIPHTLAEDGDPLDIMVITPTPVVPGSVIRSRPLGVLHMEDENGKDDKIFAVPVSKVSPLYDNVKDLRDVSEGFLDSIKHFFEHYKDLEKGKWVKVSGWGDIAAAEDIIRQAITRF